MLQNRIDVVTYISVRRSLLQGNTDDNEPRIDLETRQGLYTPMGFKRQIRDYLSTAYGMPMWVARKADLSETPLSLAQQLGLPVPGVKAPKKGKKKVEDVVEDELKTEEKKDKSVRLRADQEEQIIKALGAARYDFRAFGGILTPFNLGVKGPCQFNLAESVDPITISRLGITRCAVANEEEAAGKDRTMGEYAVVNYGLYRSLLSVVPAQAQRTGFDEADLGLMLEAMLRCFENSVSTLRSDVYVPVIYLFRHDSSLGNMPRHKLFDRIQVVSDEQPQSFKDYRITEDFEGLEGVTAYKIESVSDIYKIFPAPTQQAAE